MTSTKQGMALTALFLLVMGCTAETTQDDVAMGGAAVSEGADGEPLVLPSFTDRAEAVCPSSHPKRKLDQTGFGNQHDQCCYGTITPYCRAGATADACGRGEAYVIGPGVDRCAARVEAVTYLKRGAATCAPGFRAKVDPKVAEARTPIQDTTLAAHDECCKGSTCRPPACPPGEMLARVDGPDQCVRAVPSTRFTSVGKAKCPAGLVRTNDARDRTIDTCCPDDVRANYPAACQPLLVTKDACPAGSKVVSVLGDDECLADE